MKTHRVNSDNRHAFVRDHLRKTSRQRVVINTLLNQLESGQHSSRTIEKQLNEYGVDTRQAEISWLLRHFESSNCYNNTTLETEVHGYTDQQLQTSRSMFNSRNQMSDTKQ